MKYQLQPKQAIFKEDGLTCEDGWATIYNVDPISGEFVESSYEYLPRGVSLPAHAFLDAPIQVDDEHAIIRTASGWAYPRDHRGKKVYSTETGAESIVDCVGDIPRNYTLLAPTSDFDSWDGEKWILDTEKQHQFYVEQATAEKAQLITDTTATISYLQDAVEAEIATEEETAAFAAWKKYRVLLNRIDVNHAPEITWPEKP